ncbi:hypothetical protein BDV98DRAFT_605573 [Pterulicium gracile]|uniref:DUF1772-domain-containing protein n=1 Tax=Pterulicium gracile TaxID=1884261 RepID=A0A5C3QIT2_9AGAR|nr:hypothetical protein BDV98DRAFT_605573 [Pterula gracilis]
MASNKATLALTLQVIGVSLSLIGTGMNIGFSHFAMDALKTQPASRSLPTVRWLFSRGSHTIPMIIFISSACFSVLSVLPDHRPTMSPVFRSLSHFKMGPVNVGYLGAAAFNAAIGLVTMKLMLGNNFALIEMNEKKGGARSVEAAEALGQQGQKGPMSADESISGAGQPSQFTDLSGPQPRTDMDTTPEEDKEVREMLELFTRQNLLRIGLSGVGGLLGLVTALA